MGVYTFRIKGQMHHLIGSLLPAPDDLPAFAQVFMHGGGDEAESELRIEQCGTPLNPEIVQQFMQFMYEKNPYARAFMMAEEVIHTQEPRTLRLTTVTVEPGAEPLDPRRYNLPTVEEVAVVIEGDGEVGAKQRDIILRRTGGQLQRISELHSAYLALRYPLLFPYGSQQWHETFCNPTARSRFCPLRTVLWSMETDLHTHFLTGPKGNVTDLEWYAYLIFSRPEFSAILASGRLFQELAVDMYVCLEHGRL